MPNRSIQILRPAMALLIVLSVGLLLWQHFGMVKVLRIAPEQFGRFVAVDDRSQGGLSRAELTQGDGGIIMKCSILKSAYQWPYCQVRITLAAMPNGMDLSRYDYVIFDLSRKRAGPGKSTCLSEQFGSAIQHQRLYLAQSQ
jgi:hypothetical protein